MKKMPKDEGKTGDRKSVDMSFNKFNSHDYGKFIRVFVEHLHQQGAFNEVLELQRLQQHHHHKPKQVPSVRSRRRSRKAET